MRSRTAPLAAVFVMLSASLCAVDKPITLALESEGFTQEGRAPLQAYLSASMGRPVTLVVFDSYNEVVACLQNGLCDFAYLGALSYIRSHVSDGFLPLVRRTDDLHLHSLFITGTNSSIHSLRDLKGKQFAFGDIDSASGHLIPYHELLADGINPQTDFTLRYSGSHPATAALVESGAVDAGAIDETVFNSLIRNGNVHSDKIRVFFTSQPFVGNIYVARKDIPKAEQDRFAHVLLALKEGRDDPILKILLAKQFVPANDQEYTAVRQIVKELEEFWGG
jgi:phosphonate transport system substrate-binding protein